jgi:hypothetical protein
LIQHSSSGSSRAIALLSEATKSYAHSIRYGGALSANHEREIIVRYLERVFRSDFRERIPLNQENYDDQARAIIPERLEKIAQHVNEHIRAFADKACRTRRFDSLRPPRHLKRNEPIDIHADILDL